MTDDERQPVSNDAPDGPPGTETDPWWARPGRQVGLIIAGIAVLIGLGLSLPLLLRQPPEDRASAMQARRQAQVLARGETLYDAACAECHGLDGKGYAQSLVLAPPLDGSAHSWHHPDSQILGLLRFGGTTMPAVAAEWSDDDVEAVLTFVKSRWEPWQRAEQPGTIGEEPVGTD